MAGLLHVWGGPISTFNFVRPSRSVKIDNSVSALGKLCKCPFTESTYDTMTSPITTTSRPLFEMVFDHYKGRSDVFTSDDSLFVGQFAVLSWPSSLFQ